ncbi:MAG TPA: hypothetical protein VGF59_00995 [Bryobacteraceae bacterium]|jgi:hypothetical protein
MPETSYRGRSAASIENDTLRVTVLQEGGHIAEILHKPTGINPLWTPPWPSIEPSSYDPKKHPEYGADAESKLLAGIMGHNLCLDVFGGPSPEEFTAGITVHGEASVEPYDIRLDNGRLVLHTHLPLAQLEFERTIELHDSEVRISETVSNLSAYDRPIAWTQHVTLGPPFLERGTTQFRASATRSKVFESDFGSAAYLKTGAVFDWPMGPLKNGGSIDMRVFNSSPVSGAFTTHLMDPHRDVAFFAAYSPSTRLVFGYIWNRADFPWLGIWEENHSRNNPPWNGKALTRGMEFGASPMPETRRQMIDRGNLFGVPAFRWLPARSRAQTTYRSVCYLADAIPDTLG